MFANTSYRDILQYVDTFHATTRILLFVNYLSYVSRLHFAQVHSICPLFWYEFLEQEHNICGYDCLVQTF